MARMRKDLPVPENIDFFTTFVYKLVLSLLILVPLRTNYYFKLIQIMGYSKFMILCCICITLLNTPTHINFSLEETHGALRNL